MPPALWIGEMYSKTLPNSSAAAAYRYDEKLNSFCLRFRRGGARE